MTVDVTDHKDTVFAAIKAHASQSQYKPREPAVIKNWEKWGKELGVTYAEAFKKIS